MPFSLPDFLIFKNSPGLTLVVVANTLAKWKKLEPNEIDFSQGLSQKVVLASCFVIKVIIPTFFNIHLFLT